MGDWTITVHGTGAHHNQDYPNDADRMSEDFVRRLKEAGHTVHHASFTHGARQKLKGDPTAESVCPPCLYPSVCSIGRCRVKEGFPGRSAE